MASVQFVVTATSFAFTVIQVPAPTARAPEVVVRPPPSRAFNEVPPKDILPPEIVRPLEEARLKAEIPPANVLVAVVEVALIAAKLGVVVPTTFPDESV